MGNDLSVVEDIVHPLLCIHVLFAPCEGGGMVGTDMVVGAREAIYVWLDELELPHVDVL